MITTKRVIDFVALAAVSMSTKGDRQRAVDLLRELQNAYPQIEVGDYLLYKADYEAICDYLRQDRKISALKLIRTITGLGLKEAKAIVDTLQEEIDAGRNHEVSR